MAVLTPQTIVRTGLLPSLASAGASGDKFANTRGRTFLYVINGQGDAMVLTLDITSTVDGAAVVDPTISLAAGEARFVGPFDQRYEDSAGDINFSYDDETSVTVAAIKL